MGRRYTSQHRVSYYECDTLGRMTIPMMLSIVIKTSEGQSDELNRGADYVNNLGLAWVITHYEIFIERMPMNGEDVSITTEATGYNRFFCYRNFWIYDSNGREIVRVESAFVLMDLEARKLAKVQEEIVAPYECEKTKMIKRYPNLPKIDLINNQDYRVRFLDIDGNKHVNNSKYIEWMMDCLGYEFLIEQEVTYILLKFDKEVEYGHVVKSKWEFDTTSAVTSVHRIEFNGQTYAEGLIKWK